MKLGEIFRLCSISSYATMLTLGLVLSIATRKKLVAHHDMDVQRVSVFGELEYTNYVGNIIPHAITSLM